MAILVAGMHRSGTSAVMRALSAANVHVGEAAQLMDADDSNAFGHYELLAAVTLNDELLHAVGGEWRAPLPQHDELAALADGELGERARNIFSGLRDRAGAAPVAVKDPRFSLTLAFWRAALGDSITHVVLPWRHPTEVADSLRARNQIPEPTALSLWRHYHLRLFEAIGSVPLVPVDYATLVSDPTEAISVLLTDLGLNPGPTAVDAATRAIDAASQHETRRTATLRPDVADTLQAIAAITTGVRPSAALTSPTAHEDELFDLAATIGRELFAARADKQSAEHKLTAMSEAHADQQLASRQLTAEVRRELIVRTGERNSARSDLETARINLEAERDEARAAHALAQQEVDSFHSSAAGRLIVPLWNLRSNLSETPRTASALLGLLRNPKALGRPPAPSRPAHAGATGGAAPDATDLDPVHFTLPALDDAGAPDVSIVIPVYSQLGHTARCLASIADASNDVSYEVIVVDDQSPDDVTLPWLRECTGLTLIANEENLGYLRSTNAGAAQARGHHICLLNNDTQVHDGWLDALVAPMADATVGAVGAKLIYPDGTLQEAGSIIWEDGLGWNYGRYGDPDAPEHDHVREVDYCSAACLLVRGSAWRDLGGYDERYAPAYYEDPDLCFALRERGLRVLYQPGACIVHDEGVSHGTDEDSGGKAGQKRNRAKFMAKWGEQLRMQAASDGNPDHAAWRARRGRVLVIDNEVPAPDQDAGSLRMEAILGLLGEIGFKPTFLPANCDKRDPYTRALTRQGVHVIHGDNNFDAILARWGGDIEAVIVSRPEPASTMLPILARSLPGVPVIYDMVDFHTLRLQRQHERHAGGVTADEVDAMAALELHAATEADLVLAVTQADADALGALAPDAVFEVLPTIHPDNRSEAAWADRSGVIFVGSFRHHPNRDAIGWLVDEIMPAVWKRDPDIHLHLVGSDIPEGYVQDSAQVIMHGWVQDLDPLFETVRLNVAPLRYGAGIKGKIGDSLARGVPTVTTALGAEGFGPVAGSLAIGATADEIAQHIVAIHGDEQRWTRAAEVGVAAIDTHFGLQAARGALRRALAAVNVTV